VSAGKGDTPRPVNGDAFRDNYEAAFRKAKWPHDDNPFMSADHDNDSHNMNMNNIDEIIDERNKAQSESEYWKAEADRWREVALLQDAQIETIMAKLEHRMRKIESGIRELQ
jgi:hypothetical protein